MGISTVSCKHKKGRPNQARIQTIGFQDSASVCGVFHLNVNDTLGIQQGGNDYFARGVIDTLAFVQEALGSNCMSVDASNILTIVDSTTFAGCLCIVAPGGDTPLTAQFDSNTFEGQVVYVSGNGTVDLAQSDVAATTGAIGFANGPVTAGATGEYLTEGQVTLPSWLSVAGTPVLTPGALYYLSPDNPGQITTVEPTTVGQFSVVVGRALTETTLDIEVNVPRQIEAPSGGGGNTVLSATFDSDTVIGEVLYITSTGNADLARADADATTCAIGLALTGTLAGNVGDYITEGQITQADWTQVTGSANLIPGATYFLSPTMAGQLTTTAPTAAGEYVVRVGKALSTDTLDVEIAAPILLTGNTNIPGGGDSGIPGTYDSATEVGMAVYVTGTGTIDLAQADAALTACAIGLSRDDVAAGDSGVYFTEGQVTRTDWTSVVGSATLTPGATYFLDPSLPGQMTVMAPTTAGEYVVSMGRAVDANTFDIEVQPPILLTGNTSTGGGGVGSTITTTFDSNTSQGMVVYVKPTGNADLAEASAEATTCAIGLAVNDVNASDTGEFATEGQITSTDWTAVTGQATLTPGTVYYLSSTNPGQLTDTAPTNAGEFVVVVGKAVSADTLDIEIDQPILLSGNTSVGSGGGNSSFESTFDSNTSEGMVVYVASTGNVDLANAAADATTCAIGFAAEDVIAGQTGSYLTDGQVTLTDWTAVTGTTALTPGAEYFLSKDNDGQITTVPPSAPGEHVVFVGKALSDETLDIEIDRPVLLSGNTGGTGSGSSIQAVFDSVTATGMVVYVTPTGTAGLALADADATTDAVGLAIEDVLAGGIGTYRTEGQVELTDWTAVTGSAALTPGATYFLSKDSPGQLTETAPSAAGEYVVVVGRALSATTLDIEVGDAILLSGNTTVPGVNPTGFTVESFQVSAAQESSLQIQLAGTVTDDHELLFINGVHQVRGCDYTMAGDPTVVTFDTDRICENDFVVIKYLE